MELVFTDKATEMLVSVALFIEEKWNLKEAEKFLLKAYQTFDLLLEHPHIFKASTLDPKIRIGIIAKQCSFFYEIREKEIVILFLWDNRQDPIL
ncbi:type II toxin-antitoxin system RelE/ParE family toxin [Pedobacter cryotolerans]|uniref:Type II toxin-antitoxin system RelE/ParE family toxin n=1 Tax=Pedobacter cryotolerans TaxID=2571270 RepID=A0A4U1BZP7_9SPHI|nr:type II toxin-antitoxin system RelE/ParE family toxin [Pedobacter cryotolerans]TKB98026.1 type II toxin-antitoxin system RelE/ParE family toxin [Pedobacter cryotolerans]